jgi:hypothetical protein
MVAVAQSVERQIVALEVAGSSPVGHPKTRESALCAGVISAQGTGISIPIMPVCRERLQEPCKCHTVQLSPVPGARPAVTHSPGLGIVDGHLTRPKLVLSSIALRFF